MPKKPTKASIKAAAELIIKHEGSVKNAIGNCHKARLAAKDSDDAGAVATFDRLIKYCEER